MPDRLIVEQLVDQKIRLAFERYELERRRKVNDRLWIAMGVLNWIAAISFVVLIFRI